MDVNELLHESFDYQDFFTDNTDDYQTLTCVETMNVINTISNSNENLVHFNNHGNTPMKNRTTGEKSFFIQVQR